MTPAPAFGGEAARLAALQRYHMLDTPAEEAFDDLARLAAQVSDTPIGLLTLVDRDRLWFKARVGLDMCEAPRDAAFCAQAILGRDLLLVPDATQDPRFAGRLQVAGPPHLRFYAGVPLRSPEGHAVGTLCVLDTVPRQLSPVQQGMLTRLGRLAVGQLELRRKSLELREAVERPGPAVAVEEGQASPRELREEPARMDDSPLRLEALTGCPPGATPGVSRVTLDPIRPEEPTVAVTPPSRPGPCPPGTPDRASAGPDSDGPMTAAGCRVLVVDDNAVNQKVAARMLTRLGCVVDVAAHGREALEMVMTSPYAVIFMDCMMPEMDGYEATGAIRKLEGPAAKTPIVAMTANAMQGDRERCLASGMDDYLSKPVQPALLRQALERWGAHAQLAAPDAAPPVDPTILEAFRQLQEDGRPDVVTEFIDLFLADLPDRRAAIIAALSEHDPERTRAAAHALKGSAAYIGARELARLCRDLEAAVRSGDTDSASRTGVALEQEAERVTRYLSSARQLRDS